MPNCLQTNISEKKCNSLPIEEFKLPAPLPNELPLLGEGFATGTIDLGCGLQVRKISSFKKVWSFNEGGPQNMGATFYEPSSIPEGFFMLGHYAQPNNRKLFGWVLVAKDDSDTHTALKEPLSYTLVWSSESLNIKQEYNAHIWLPKPPVDYKAIGYVVTHSCEKPSLEKIRCVRSCFTDQCETETWIWGPSKDSKANGFNIFDVRPKYIGTQAMGVCVGTFAAVFNNNCPFFSRKKNTSPLSISCLKNFKSNLFSSSMPNHHQIEKLFETYSPYIYFHPDEKFLPSSVSWFFDNGALLHKKGENSIKIERSGSNLPQGDSSDIGDYRLELPVDDKDKERVKKGDLQSAEVYLHIKPMLGATFTDIAIWVFYPYNGPARVKVECIDFSSCLCKLKIGEHVCDWEHFTLRVSNFDGMLWKVYFSEHSGGSWVKASELEFQGQGNKFVTYASLNGHAMYAKPGPHTLRKLNIIGLRNDTAKCKMFDTASKFSVVAAEYLGSSFEPPWLNYFGKWGSKICCACAGGIEGPKVKPSWSEDEDTKI